jgi:hypothetical protein
MAYFKRTNIFQSIVFSRGMALVLIFLIVFMGFGLFSIVGKSMDAAKARRVSEAQATALKQKEEDLSMKLAALNTIEGQEAALREQFPVVKPGERVVVITDENAPITASAFAATEAPSKGFWNFLKGIFK